MRDYQALSVPPMQVLYNGFTVRKLTSQIFIGPTGHARNSDTSLFRRLNGPKYFPLDRHATMPTVQCYENGTHWSEGPFVRLFKKEAH